MQSRWFIMTAILVAASLNRFVPANAQTPGVVGRLAWMSGCWQRTARNGQTIDEQWMTPRGESMLGMSCTVRGDSLIEYEQLRIGARGGHAVYFAAPSGQSPSEFTAASVSDTLVIFENPQ